MNSRFRATTPTAFSIGVNITITNPDVIVVVVMFTFFLARRRKGPTFTVQIMIDDEKKNKKTVALSGMVCVQGINDY